MNITDDMILRACYTWTGDSRPLQVEKDAMRKVLTEFAAALAAQPAEPVAIVEYHDICADHNGQVLAFDYLPQGTKLYAAPQPQRAEQWLPHIYAGYCPDELQPDARDPNCPACRALAAPQPARVPLTDEQMREALAATNDMVRNSMRGPFWPELEQACRAIERTCAEKWGITLADTEGGGK